jgi:hypothetical protein
LIAPGSQRLANPEGGVKSVVRRWGVICLPTISVTFFITTPILHCSEAARDPVHRRGFVDFAAGDLPGGLTWLGV